MTLIPLNHLFSKSLERAGIARQVFSALVVERFHAAVKKVIGERAAKHVKALYLKNKVLTVACLHSVLSQELHLRETEILKELNAGQPKPIVERIRYMV
jgi:predicted nucleic acid-binding Zn ribbon protein